MKSIKVVTIIVCLLLLTNTRGFSQIKPSLYVGVGTITNLGSVFGIGVEVKYHWVSLSIATGPGIFTEHKLLYDVGVKVYPNSKYHFFGGINYGYVRGYGGFFDSDNDYYGFALSGGYRFTIYKKLYGMGYLGATSDYTTFMPEEKREHAVIPRIGFIIGYDFLKKTGK